MHHRQNSAWAEELYCKIMAAQVKDLTLLYFIHNLVLPNCPHRDFKRDNYKKTRKIFCDPDG